MTNTSRTIQVYDEVPAGQPNEGAPAIDDALQSEILAQAGLSDDAKRTGKVLNLVASTMGNTFDPLLAKVIYIDMEANLTNLTVTNDGAFNGQLALLIFQQDAVGSRTVSWLASKFQGGMDQGIPVLQGTANSRDYVVISWNAKDSKFDIVGQERRYP